MPKINYFFIQLFLFFSVCIFSHTSNADTICANTSSTSTTGTLYDSGGSSRKYSNNENCSFLIQPSGGGSITLSFTSFEYESNYDFLYVYDGTNSSGTLLGRFSGSSRPSDVTATSGAMYIVHTSDRNVKRDGFSASWSISASLSTVAEWHFDEDAWVGQSGEVLDSVGSLHGVAVNGVSTVESGQVCGAASFDGSDDYITVTGIDTYLSTTASVSFWMNTAQRGDNTSWRAPGITGVEQAGGGNDIFWGWIASNGRLGITKGNGNKAQTSSAISDSNWHHIVLTRNSSSGQLEVYVDGNFVARVTGTTGDVTTGFSSIGRIEDTGGTPEYFAGQLDELLVFDQVISADQVQSIYNNQSAGNHWDGSARSCDLSPIAEWRLEEDSWTGVSDEVIDSSGNNYHGQLVRNASPQNSSPAIEGSTGTCSYGSFNSGMISVSDLPVDTSSGAKTTVTFWMYWDGTNASMPIGWSHYDLWFYSGSFGFNTWNSDIYGISSSSLSGGWHHITAEFTNGYSPVTSNRLWVDGVEQSLSQRRGRPSSSYRSVGSDFRLGGASNSSGYFFHGLLDEVRIYSGTLSTSQVNTIMNETHPCGNEEAGYFSIAHDNSAVYCLSESLSVTAKTDDSSVLSTYSGTITLDTQSGTGTWALASGSGAFQDSVSNDGLATYTFDEADSGTASFTLQYQEGNSVINIDAYDGSARDDDSEGDISFSATGFSVTANPLSNPPVTPINDPIASPQSSGQAFSVALAAYGVDPDNGQCGIIETYTGNKSITVSTQYNNPSTGTLSVSGSGTVSFVSGQATINTQYDDVGSIRLTVTDSSENISGQSTDIIVKPTDFSISVLSNPATTDGGSGFIAAGEAFTVDVQALNALGNSTPNYGNEQTPESVTVALDSLVFPLGGTVGTLSNGSSFSKTGTNTFRNTAAAWNEVGSIRLSASVADGNYLGAGDVSGSASGTVGRFYPHSFYLGSQSVTNSCDSFTYLSQPDLSIAYTLAAIASDGETVSNYDEGLGYPVGSIAYSAELDDNGNNLSARFSTSSSTWSAGEYVLADTNAAFARVNSVESPLTNVVFGVAVNDIDDREMNAPNMNAGTSGDCAESSDCNAVSIGTGSFYYGRLRLDDAYGPETAALPVTFITEYWNGAKFVSNVYDHCTVISRSVVSINNSAIISASDLTVNLTGGTTTAQFSALSASDISFTSGDAGLSFSAPGASIAVNSFIMDVDLSSMSWLRYDWDQDGSDSDNTVLPTATMSFKTYRGHDRILYWRHR